jgi:hypothetical protein
VGVNIAITGANSGVGKILLRHLAAPAALSGFRRQGGMTPTVIDVITSSEVVHENADAELGVLLTPLSATLEKLLPSQVKVAHP